jgi:hypothetical protein
MRPALVACALALSVGRAEGQSLTERGFAEGWLWAYPSEAPRDPTRVVGDALARDEVFFKPARWLELAGGLDVRAGSHGEVDDTWRLDFWDRGARRPRLSVRRLAATLSRGGLTVDVGKQFIRWGKTDIVAPTDRFAPRDFLNVVDSELLAVVGVRGAAQRGADAFEVVWLPRLTPSRVPLFDQRWTVVPGEAGGVAIVDGGSEVPSGSETGVRWSHTGSRLEHSLSFVSGFNNLPNVVARPGASPASLELVRVYPTLRAYGADAAWPTRWLVVKAEAAYLTSTSPATDQYVLYVIQFERQSGEWTFVWGYAGEAVTERRAPLAFTPDRGLARSIVGRVGYTIDARRSVAVESVVRRSGDGVYVKGEYSQAQRDRWRITARVVAIAGASDDFLGQFRRNSHVAVTLRYSF